MTQDEIIRMAKEVGFVEDTNCEIYGSYYHLERFAALVAEPWIETNKALAKEIIELKKQAEQEPVAVKCGCREGCQYCQGSGWILANAAPVQQVDLTDELQQKCFDWGTYWRAPDAHGVNLSIEQATELLRDALGVEVEIAPPVRTKDLTDAELHQIWRDIKSLVGLYSFQEIARAVIAADREKNK